MEKRTEPRMIETKVVWAGQTQVYSANTVATVSGQGEVCLFFGRAILPVEMKDEIQEIPVGSSICVPLSVPVARQLLALLGEQIEKIDDE